MVKNSVNRLLHVVIPFGAMVFLQRVLLFAVGYLNIDRVIAELLAFIPSAVCAAIMYSLLKFSIDEEKNEEPVAMLVPRPAVISALQCAVAVTLMIWAMYAVSIIMGGISEGEVELTPLSVISLVIIHPILEEYIFRGLFYKELRQMNPIFGVLAEAVMFAIVHSEVSGMIYALVSGIALAVLVEVSGRLIPAIAAHMAINLRSLLYLTVFSESPEIIRTIDTVILALGILAFAGVHVILARRAESDHGKTAEVKNDV